MKKNNLAFLLVLMTGLVSSVVLNVSAQKVETKQLEKVNVQNKTVENYIKVSSMDFVGRKKAFIELAAEEKSSIFRLHLATQFVIRPNLTTDKKNIILETINSISPTTYNDEVENSNNQVESQALEARATSLFSERESFEIFAIIGGNQENTKFLTKYLETVSLPSRAERQQFFRDAPQSDRSEIWKAQMVYYLATYEFSKPQQDFILDVISLSTPQSFAFSASQNLNENVDEIAMDKLEKRAFELFSKEQIAKVFMNLGENATCTDQKKIDKTTSNLGGNCNCNWFCGLNHTINCLSCG